MYSFTHSLDLEEFDELGPVTLPHIRAHTTVDYLHYLVPGLARITNCGFYWGVMDRYEAEALLDDKPEGTFLLRDSSQVSLYIICTIRHKKYQWNLNFVTSLIHICEIQITLIVRVGLYGIYQ